MGALEDTMSEGILYTPLKDKDCRESFGEASICGIFLVGFEMGLMLFFLGTLPILSLTLSS